MRIYIGGDICPTSTTAPAFEACDMTTLFGGVPELMSDGDIRFANLECALTDSDAAIRKCGPNLKGKPSYAKALKQLKLDLVGLSNNHVFDFGRQGLTDTVQALTGEGLAYAGIGQNEKDARKPYYLTACGKTVAFLCVAEHEYSYALPDRAGVWGFDPFETMEDIQIARQKADYVIVIYHGGKEQCRFPSPRLRKACQAMVRAGADFITCQHSHCIGVYEEYKDAKIVYGQGNFNFAMNLQHPHWQNGTILQLDIDDQGHTELTFHPTHMGETGVQLAEGEEKQRELTGLQERSALLQDEESWLKEWHAFCVSMQTTYRNSVLNAYPDRESEMPGEIFPHYLDCEAHTDVWRELFQTWHKRGIDEQNG